MGKEIITIAIVVLLFAGDTCLAGCCAKSAAPKNDSLEANLIETTLNQLKEKTGQLRSYQCELEYLFSQPLLESATLRKGVLYYQKSDGRSKLRINFQTLKQDDEEEQKYVEHYVFDGVWLTVIDYQIRQVKRYQQSEPNEPIDAFELASRNFPLIGFSSVEELRKEFEIELAEQEGSKEENFIKLGLKVKPDSIYKDDYSKVEFWIDKGLGLPAKIVAVSTEEDIYEVKFLKAKVNERINEKVFEVKIPEGFGVETIPLRKERSAAPEAGTSNMVSIANVRVSQENLVFDYRIKNGFPHDIWVCEDIDIYGRFDVATRIKQETLFIKLSFNLPCNVLLLQGVEAKYRRLPPDVTHKGKISLELPIKNASPVYHFDEPDRKKVVELHHAVFEVGYFAEDLLKMISDDIKKGKEDPNDEDAYCMMLILEEIEKKNSSDVAYIPHLWVRKTNEKVSKVDITNVSIPCYVTDKKQ
jgi:outer membrane lipoprotein-sorting protein